MNAASGARPISSDSARSTPSSAASSPTASQACQSGVMCEVEQVHGDLGTDRVAALGFLHAEPVALHPRQPAARFADAACDPLRQLHVVRIEVDVPGDEEGAGADGQRAGSWMHPGRAEVGLAAVLRDLRLEALVLAPADIGQLDPVGSHGGPGVEVDRQREPCGDPRPELAGQLDAGVQRGVAERDERDHVHGPDPRVLAGVDLHVDVLDRLGDQPLQADADRLVLARDGEHGPVVAGVRGAVQEVDAR